MQRNHENLEHARQYALRSLTCCSQTEAQMRKKLQLKEFDEETVEQVLVFLKQYSFINDERFTEEYVMTHCKRMNRRQILERLYGKGIQKVQIDNYLEEGNYDEEQLLKAEIEKYRRRKPVQNPADVDKMRVYMMKKGYSASLVRVCLREMQ